MIKVKSNIDILPGDFEQINIDYQTDMTVPNQSLSVNDILTNFTRGVGMQSVARSVYYDGLDDFDSDDDTLRPDFDLSDVSSLSEEINASIAESQRKARKKIKEEETDEEIEDEPKAKNSAKKGVSEPKGEESPKTIDDK